MLPHHFLVLCASLAWPGRCRVSTCSLTHLALELKMPPYTNWTSGYFGVPKCSTNSYAMGSQKWQGKRWSELGFGFLCQKIQTFQPQALIKNLRAKKLNGQGWICGIVVLASLTWPCTGMLSYPGCAELQAASHPQTQMPGLFLSPSLLSLAFLFCCWQGAQNNITLKWAFPAHFMGCAEGVSDEHFALWHKQWHHVLCECLGGFDSRAVQ